ncbi:hypothetical protein OU995_18420 [Roseateles sp. SL47]|uniref:hypothetical protein n=1 Tax=Roseateles sp. SL47 TaxID=2995138 RepID=UPI00226D78A7|nr:hypothetical protein [Roseateles sp. SL47]WAC71547.1 hypothetical protein OU995_18420 [Roseateles sp. SL47]
MSQDQDIPVATGTDLQPGQIEFIESCEPPLVAGTYQLSWTQQVLNVTADPAPSYSGTQAFQVSGPRFTLPADSVQSVYPPASQKGNFADVMPHIVLNRSTLPWERPLQGNTPWLALLLLTDEELQGAPILSIPVSELLAPPSGTTGPAIPASAVTPQEAQSLCNAIDVSAAVFTGLAPTLQEVALLCHARRVNTDNKEELGIQANGTFSVVIGNRLVPAHVTSDTAYTALLVSLEGWTAQLPGYASDGTTPTSNTGTSARLRLCVLASWGFRASAGVGSFSGLMRNLSQPGGIGMLQYSHGTDVGNAVAQTALDIGFVPLVNNTRFGEQTSSWYRGPLSAAPTNPSAVPAASFSDTLTRYDPATGLLDQSYAVAWQIGRLLGLADAAFARSIFDWRRTVMQGQLALQSQSARRATLPDDPAMARLTATRPADVSPALQAQATVFDVARHYLLTPDKTAPTLPKVTPHARRGDALRSQQLKAPAVRPGNAPANASSDPLLRLIDHVLGGQS